MTANGEMGAGSAPDAITILLSRLRWGKEPHHDPRPLRLVRLPRRRGKNMNASERFDRLYMPEPNSGCWLWTGAAIGSGYGQMWAFGKPRSATHVSWFLRYGVWPDLNVLHRCDTPPCVNPDHLFLGTAADNFYDMKNKGRDRRLVTSIHAAKTHCPHGHEYDEHNTRVDHYGGRHCRACDREQARARRRLAADARMAP